MKRVVEWVGIGMLALGTLPPAGSRALLDWLAGIVGPIDGDRPFGEDLQHLIETPWPPA